MQQNKAIDCFAYQKLVMRLLGFSISKSSVCYKIYCFTLLTTLTIYPISVLPEIIKLFYDFNELIYSSMFEIGYIAGVLSIYCIIYNKKRMVKIFEQIQYLGKLANCNDQHQNNPNLTLCENVIRKQSIFGIALGVLALVGIISVSIFFSRKKQNWILPFGSGPSIGNNNFQFFSQIIMYQFLANSFILIVFIFINMLTILCCHCKILQKFIKNTLPNSLENLRKNSRVKNKSNLSEIIIPWKFIELELKKLVNYHVGIIELAAEIEKVFYIIILIFFIGLSSILCMAMLQLISNSIDDTNLVKNVTVATISYVLMWAMAYRGEQVLTESRKIAEACSEINFIGSDIRLQRYLMMIIRQGQKPIFMTLGKIKTLSLSTILAVFQTCYSYYTLLRNIKN